MNKKEYIIPAVLKVRNVYPTHIICGSGGTNASLSSGGGGNQPTSTNKGGNIGIFGDSKLINFVGSSNDQNDEW